MRTHLFVMALCSLLFATPILAAPADLEKSFAAPPDAARPWVYWFWLNGNITREGITADLEAMKRVGIGGVLIMEVDQGAPRGPVDFMSAKWRDLFKHVVAEAQRLGLEVNMNDDAGWNGSGGPWIKPDQSMQKIVWGETNLEGPQHFDGKLPPPPATAGYYRDITVLAVPTPGAFRIDNIKGKAGYERQGIPPIADTALAPEMVIDRAKIVDLGATMDKDGHLAWDVPAGKWTLLRLGHTSTGATNSPSPQSGCGLECDKLSPAGIEAQFAGMMGPLATDVGPAAGKTLVATHIDSWENGSQNWTARMREEFQKRRGYDPLPYLPAVTGRVVGSLEISERFLWDLRQTVSDLVVEDYAGRAAALAKERGLRLSIEAYGGPCDDLTYGCRADEPMCEFWIGGGAFDTVKGMASAAHLSGKPILGAESFTADDHERWLQHPASIKSLGDRAFAEGVSRFVFHRYAMQPWLAYRPGMTMGPWGLHYERTDTWWELTRPWHEYLARCQFLLRQGRFVADLCYLQPEEAPQGFAGHPRENYDYDLGSAEAVLTRMAVKDGRIVLPDGMSYRALVLPPVTRMTPPLLAKIKELVEAGATVVGARPLKSPSLADYPKCDEEVKRLADVLWGDADGKTVTEHPLGKGRVVWGLAPEKWLAAAGVAPDFASPTRLNWIHRADGDTDLYFVANPTGRPVKAACTFRVSGKPPELWRPETGRIERAAVWSNANAMTTLPLQLGPSESVFVVFRPTAGKPDPIVSVACDGRAVLTAGGAATPKKVVTGITIEKATYGVPGDAARTRDVKAKAQKLVDAGELSFQVARMAEGDDPAFRVVKTLVIEYTAGGKKFTATGTDPEMIDLADLSPAERVVDVCVGADGKLLLEASQPGAYELTTASGKVLRVAAAALPPAVEVSGPWEVRFPPNSGAPDRVTLEKLLSWSEHGEAGVWYFSGTATYSRTIDIPKEFLAAGTRVYLDLGRVEIMAEVKLNGKDLGILWKPPYSVDVTEAAKAGANTLEVRVTNLMINRMIGDEELPEDSKRNGNGTLQEWPPWVLEGKPSPTGRLTFTSWRLWKKGEPLRESGLLGPVTLRAATRVTVP